MSDTNERSVASAGSVASDTGLYVELPTFQPNVVQRVPVKGCMPQSTLTKAEREVILKFRKFANEIARDNAFIDEVRDSAEAAVWAIDSFIQRHK